MCEREGRKSVIFWRSFLIKVQHESIQNKEEERKGENKLFYFLFSCLSLYLAANSGCWFLYASDT